MGRLSAGLLLLCACGSVKDNRYFDAGPVDVAMVDARPDASIDAFVTPASCKKIKQLSPSASSGVYMVDPDGMGSITAFQVYCNMTMDGGGWTLAMALMVDSTGLTWDSLVPSFQPPLSPTASTPNVLHHTAIAPSGVTQMMLMGGDRI